MRATKENCERAVGWLKVIQNRLANEDAYGHQIIEEVAEFLTAAHRQLPSEATFESGEE